MKRSKSVPRTGYLGGRFGRSFRLAFSFLVCLGEEVVLGRWMSQPTVLVPLEAARRRMSAWSFSVGNKATSQGQLLNSRLISTFYFLSFVYLQISTCLKTFINAPSTLSAQNHSPHSTDGKTDRAIKGWSH